MRRALAVVGAVITAGLLAASSAEPCDRICVQGKRGRHALSRYKFVIAGKVVRSHGDGAWTVAPVRVWQGPGDLEQFRVENRQGMCGYTLAEGAYYVFYLDHEDEDIGDCMHEPLAFAQARDEIGALDRARSLAPLRVPEEALLPPHHMGCAEQFAVPDRMLADAERVVVGRFARNDVISSTNMTSRLQGDLLTTEWVKGRGPRSVPVIKDFDYPMGNAEDFSKPHVWFLGPRRADGRTEVIGSWYAGGLQDVKYRYERWRILGADCVTP
jgi:hypothetical protein